jgi:hypothetical protein
MPEQVNPLTNATEADLTEKAIRGSGAIELAQTAGIVMGGAGGLAAGAGALITALKGGGATPPQSPEQQQAPQPPKE